MSVVSVTPDFVIEWRAKRELELGVPAMRGEAEEWYRCQTVIWKPWVVAVLEHRWSFLSDSPCQNCGQLTTTIEAATMTLCPECLNMGPPWWPTGWAMETGTFLVRHSENCTSHSSYPTSSSSMYSEEAYLRYTTANTRKSGSKPTSSSPTPTRATQKSLRPMRLSR